MEAAAVLLRDFKSEREKSERSFEFRETKERTNPEKSEKPFISEKKKTKCVRVNGDVLFGGKRGMGEKKTCLRSFGEMTEARQPVEQKLCSSFFLVYIRAHCVLRGGGKLTHNSTMMMMMKVIRRNALDSTPRYKHISTRMTRDSEKFCWSFRTHIKCSLARTIGSRQNINVVASRKLFSSFLWSKRAKKLQKKQ